MQWPEEKIKNAFYNQKKEFLRKYSPLSSSFDKDDADSYSMVLDPTGKQAYNWLAIVAIAVTYFCWSIPLREAFNVEQIAWVWSMLDNIFFVVYLMDIAIQKRTGYLCDGILEQNIEKLNTFYTKSIYFKIDILIKQSPIGLGLSHNFSDISSSNIAIHQVAESVSCSTILHSY